MAYGIFRRKALAPSGGRSGRRRPLWAGWCAILLLLAAGVGCEPLTDYGIQRVGVSDGLLVAQGFASGVTQSYSSFESADGGVAWDERRQPDSVEWGTNEVNTPRGVYRISGTEIIRESPGRPPETVYEARHPRKGPDQWMRTHNARELPGIPEPSPGPIAIAYDPGSGNVVAALGLEGVVVGTAGGQWIPAPVGLYAPTDYSNSAKIRALLSREGLWLQLVITPLAMLNIMLGAAYVFRRKDAAAAPNDDGCRGMFGLFCLIWSLGFSGLILLVLSLDAVGTENAELAAAVLSIVFALPSAFLVIVLLWPRWWPMKYRIICGSLGATALVVFLTHFIWVQAGGELSLARAISLLSCAAIAILLARYIARRMPPPPPAAEAGI